MNYSEPLLNQIIVFVRAVGAGIILGLIYDALSFFRMVMGEKKWIYVTFDIAFAIVASVFSFFFMVLYNSGQVRFNLMLGELMGGVAFHLSIGRYCLSYLAKWVGRVKKFIRFVLSPLVGIFNKLTALLKKIPKVKPREKKEKKKDEKIEKKFRIISKILLKNKNKSV